MSDQEEYGIIVGPEWVANTHWDEESGSIQIGDTVINGITGFNPANIYVERLFDMERGSMISSIIISFHGDHWAQAESDRESEEAARYPLGPKEYWRTKMVGKYTYGIDNHPMTNEEFEADWDDEDGGV